MIMGNEPSLRPWHRRSTVGFLLAELKESVLMAFSSVAAHKLRSGLTLLGILIGVFSIVAVMTVIRLMERNAETSLSQLGPNTFSVQKMPGIMFEGPEGWQRLMRRKDISLEQGQAVAERATLAASVGLQTDLATGQARSDYEETNPNVNLIGVTPETFAARNWVVEFGRALLPPDMDNSRLVCVLGSSLAEKLFPYGSPVGQRMKFDGVSYTVVGVLESKGQVLGGDQDNFLAIPLSTGLGRYGWVRRSLGILVQAQNQSLFEDTKEQVAGILRSIRKVPPGAENDFEFVSNDSLISQFRTITLAVRAGAASISSIALLAAGVGIMNIMLVSVTERTREIGIRRAIGAKKRTILWQFITEAVVLCQVGGAAGVLLGVIAGNIAARFMTLPIVLPMDWAVIGMLVCSVVGVVFGTYPAVKAANLDPIESLRYE
jgi:putative ABC transport system permease protein